MANSKETLDPAVILDTIPTVNQALRLEAREAGAVAWLPIRRRWWMRPPLSWILPFRKERGFALDAIGHQVVSWCDGERTTEHLIELFATEHKVRFHTARISVLTFLRTLVRRNLMVLVQPTLPSDTTDDSRPT